MLTANDLRGVAEPTRRRTEVIHISEPTTAQLCVFAGVQAQTREFSLIVIASLSAAIVQPNARTSLSLWHVGTWFAARTRLETRCLGCMACHEGLTERVAAAYWLREIRHQPNREIIQAHIFFTKVLFSC